MKRLLILGGNGFVGSHLVPRLVQLRYQVTVFDRNRFPKWGSVLPSVEYKTGNWTNTAELEKIFATGLYDALIQLASNLVPGTPHPEAIYVQELKSHKNLLKIIDKYQVPQLVFISSGGTVYGNNGQMRNTEQSKTMPISLYGTLKLEVESLIIRASQNQDLKHLILRPSNAYGPGQSPENIQGLIGVALGCVLQQKPLRVWGDGSIIRDYIFINDLVEAIIQLLDQSVWNEVINVGSGHGTSIREIIEIVSKITHFPLEIIYDPARTVDISANILEIDKIKNLCSWQPSTDLETGIKRFWESVR